MAITVVAILYALLLLTLAISVLNAAFMLALQSLLLLIVSSLGIIIFLRYQK